MTAAESEELIRQYVYESLTRLAEGDDYEQDFLPEDLPDVNEIGAIY